MRWLWVVILIITTGCAGWTPKERALGVASCVATGLDAYSTHRALKNPNNYEMNPLMDKRPSDTQLVLTTGGVQLIILGIAHYFPKVRSWLLGGSTVIHLGAAIHNEGLER